MEIEVGKRQIDHFSHPHPLILYDDEASINRCSGCYHSIEDAPNHPYYACKRCRYCLHKSCAELPREIRHPSHPLHPLSLYFRPSYDRSEPSYGWEKPFFRRLDSQHCDAGDHRHNYRGRFIFLCSECGYVVCIECASSMGTATYEHHQDQIEHFSHQHPLIPSDQKKITNEVRCSACLLPLLGAIYSCNRCKHFLHKSCAELPRHIRHPFHPRDELILVSQCERERDSKEFECGACFGTCGRFAFNCFSCKFILDIDCAMLIPTISFYGHQHPLFLFKGPFDIRCKVCCCFGRTSYVFRCVGCDFNIHLQCGPLPSSIEHKCHVHPLTLADSVPDEDSDQFYCDVCEKERNAADRVYYCAECGYVAHIECVMSEVKSWLERESSLAHHPKEGQIETPISEVLRTSGEEVTKALAAARTEQKLATDTILVEEKQNDAAEPTLVELDEAIRKLEADIKAIATKFKAFVRKHQSSSGK